MENIDLNEYWNVSSTKIPLNKDVPIYAIEVEKQFPKNSTICDLGGSTGISSHYFISQGHQVTLVDISDIALSVAKKQLKPIVLKKLTLVQFDYSSGTLPLKNNTFDIVFARLSLHYFTKDILVKLFKDIYRILKPSGKAFITVKSPSDLTEMKFLKQTAKLIEPGVFDDNGIIKTRFSKKQYKDILKTANIPNFTVTDYIENNSDKKDITKSGNKKFKLIEIKIV